MITPAHPADVPRLLQIRHAAFSAQAPAAYSPDEGLFVARTGDAIAGLAGW
jgi:hypothetical protein